jgi:AMP deaminase
MLPDSKKALLNNCTGSISQGGALESNSPSLGSSWVACQDPVSEDEEPYPQLNDNDEVGSDESLDGIKDGKRSLPQTAILGEGGKTLGESDPPDGVHDGMLPRDIQRKTAYYDYAAEKQMSHADAKLFYQRSQLEAQQTGGSNWGSQNSLQNSPVIAATRSVTNMSSVGNTEQAYVKRSGSTRSIQSGQSLSQQSVHPSRH